MDLKSQLQNDIYIYYAVVNNNSHRQENEIASIMNIRNAAGWRLISTSTEVVDIKNHFSNLYLFFGKDMKILH